MFLSILMEHYLIIVPTGFLIQHCGAINLAKENGHKVFICTGRSIPSVTKNFLELNIDGIVASCGSHIIIDGVKEYFCPMPKIYGTDCQLLP